MGGPAMADREPAEATTETPEERAEARRRLDQFNAALARGMAAREAEAKSEARVEVVKIFDPMEIFDPRYAKANETDSRLWLRLLTEAAVSDLESNVDPAAGLYWNLFCVRSNGAELEPYAPKGHTAGEPLEWRIVPGPDYLGGKEGYASDRDAWLAPPEFRDRLIPLLRRMKLYARRDGT
jgi:hypothetical protein